MIQLPARAGNAPHLHVQPGCANQPLHVARPALHSGAGLLHLITFILCSKGVAKSDPGRRKAALQCGGLPKVHTCALKLLGAQVVAPNSKPRQCALWILLYQPADQVTAGSERKQKDPIQSTWQYLDCSMQQASKQRWLLGRRSGLASACSSKQVALLGLRTQQQPWNCVSSSSHVPQQQGLARRGSCSSVRA